MKRELTKFQKIILTVFCLIGGSVVVLAAIAYICTIIFKVNFLEVLKVWQLYVVWAGIIAIIVCAVAFDVRVRGSRRVLKVNKDLEDSHFMSLSEISKNDGFTVTKLSKLNEVADGIPVYAEAKGDDIRVVLKKPIHTAVIGATGTSKTTGFIEPLVEIMCRTKTKPSMIITDPKGELYTRHAEQLKQQGYAVNVIDLADVYHSTRWNPFNDVWRKTDLIINGSVDQRKGKYYVNGTEYLTFAEAETAKKELEVRLKDEIYIDLQDLIYTICPIENKNESNWEKGARDLILALAVAFWEDVYDGYMPREKFNLYNIYRTISDYAKGECEELRAYFDTRSPISKTRGLSNTVLVAQDRTLASFLTDVSQYFNWMSDTGIAALTSGNDIEFGDFDEAPNALFLKIPDEKENRYKLVTLFMTQMYKALVEKATDNKEKGKTSEQELLRNVYFVMDEFGNMPKFHNMDKVVAVGRSRHIYMIPVIQDYNQLDDRYGKEVAAIIRSNCNIQIFIGTNDENTRKAFSELCGKKKVKQVSYSENKDMSVSTSAHSVPLIYPNELEKLNDPANGVLGNAIVSCLGNYPIRAKFTPYFKAKTIYGDKTADQRKGEFINFDEEATHYDITKYTAYVQTEERILSGEQAEEQAELVGQVGQAEQVQQVEQAELIKEIRKKKIEKLISDVNNRLKVIENKIPKELYGLMLTLGNKDKLIMLDRLADDAMKADNVILAATIEQIRNYILHRCWLPEEREGVEKYVASRR